MSEIATIRPPARWARATGRRVRGRLAESEVSQERAASIIGLSQAAMSRRLSGQVDFTISELLDLAEWLDVPLADLLPRTAPAQAVASAQSRSHLTLVTCGNQPKAHHGDRHARELPMLPSPVIAYRRAHLVPA